MTCRIMLAGDAMLDRGVNQASKPVLNLLLAGRAAEKLPEESVRP